MVNYERTIESVKSGETAANRRVHALVVADTGTPSGATAGFVTNGRRKGVVTIEPTVGGTCDAKIWKRNNVSGVWARDLTVGTAGVVAVTFAGGPVQFDVSLTGYDLWALQIDNFAGALAANSWLAVTD